MVNWSDPSGSGWITLQDASGVNQRFIDMDGDGLLDQAISSQYYPYNNWTMYRNNGPNPDFLWKVENSIGGSTEITYASSTDTESPNTHLPFIVQTVISVTQRDGKGNAYTHEYDYSGGYFDSTDREFRGFRKVTAYQMIDSQSYESKTETWYHQDYLRKGKVETQILTSKPTEGHTKRVDNIWTGSDKIGVFSNGTWNLDWNGNNIWEGAPKDRVIGFGVAGDTPVVGDWNGSGTIKIGVFRAGWFYLDFNGNGVWDSCSVDKCYYSGSTTDVPVVGDWNGDGKTEIGVFRNGTWVLDANGNGVLNTQEDIVFSFGSPGDIPIAGNWNGLGGTSKIGVFINGVFYLRNSLTTGSADTVISLGTSGDKPVMGDWNGDGRTKIGIFRASVGYFYLDYNGNGVWDTCAVDKCYFFNFATGSPVAGDWSGGGFSALLETKSTQTDQGTGGPFSYSHRTSYVYDDYLNIKEEHKYGMTSQDEIHTYFSYTNYTDRWILSKPTDIYIKNASQSILSRKWMDYDSDNGNILTEEVCKTNYAYIYCSTQSATQNSVTGYEYDTYKNLRRITDPRGYITTLNYDPTQTHVYETSKCISQPNVEPGLSCTNTHTTTTDYDLGTGNLKKLIPPHLYETTYSITYEYEGLGRLKKENRPDGGWTEHFYLDFGNPDPNQGPAQRVRKQEHIVGGTTPFDRYTSLYFDGMGRTYSEMQTGPYGNPIVKETWYHPSILGRVGMKSSTFYGGIETPYYHVFTYDGLSRIIDILTPDNYHIGTTYQGLKKVVTNQRGHSTAYTYDVHQRLKKVEEVYDKNTGASYSTTEYSYDALGNLTYVLAAKSMPEQNYTSIYYNSMSKKRLMRDPDMGDTQMWGYTYDKSGNLDLQTDAKGQKIKFIYDGLNRVTEKRYGDPTPISTVYYTYDDPTVPYSKGKLTRVLYQPAGEDIREDRVLAYDKMQRLEWSQKTVGYNYLTVQKAYDSAGRMISIKDAYNRLFPYEYDVAGNLVSLKDYTGAYLVQYSDFTALGQPKFATFPKPNNVSVKTSYTYDPPTARLATLLTQKLLGSNPTDTYQNLAYQYDGKRNIITLSDAYNNITHSYTYDTLDRLLTANGTGSNPYSESYTYDRIGNIKSKTGAGTSYTYNYSSKPHAVRQVWLDPINTTYDYDANGNMIQEVQGGTTTAIQWNYDNKPTSIAIGSATTTFTYDGNGERAKKVSPSQTVLYFGENYDVRSGVVSFHLFAGNRRIASIRSDTKNQFYHGNHLGSASVVTDSNGNRKEQMEYYPFGTYRAYGNPQGTYDFDVTFPDVFHTFTGQEEDDELGLYNFKARLYDPLLGRFISPDSIVPDPENPQSLNRYSYCQNNPLAYIDPSGHEAEGVDEGGFWSTVLGFFSGIFSPSSTTSSDANSANVAPESGIIDFDPPLNSNTDQNITLKETINNLIDKLKSWSKDPLGTKARGDRPGYGYGDINLTAIGIKGVLGGTVSVQITPEGYVYICPGPAVGTKGASLSVTASNYDPSQGIIVAGQVNVLASFQLGYSFETASFFGELGGAKGAGISLIGAYCFGPFGPFDAVVK